ncbi:Hypoxic response protein 1 [Planctomycetaceae bacterium]|nr:Hypoxic response protein 1 [Planctomycetaceae bacterium]
MKVGDIMTRDVKTVHPEAALQQAAQMMAALDVGLMPVTEDGELLGMITDRDIAVRAVARGYDPTITPVRNAMTEMVICGSPQQDITEAANLMKVHQIRRLPVLDQHNHLIGDRVTWRPLKGRR